jgi:hypothetical protein
MRGTSRCALLVVVAVTVGSRPALAQPAACYTIQPGDTAAGLALRIAGNADYRHQPWFQIFDPAASRYVRKARYDHVRPGWLACILNGGSGALQTSARPAEATRLPAPLSGIARTLAGIQLDPRWYLVVLLLTTSSAWYIAHRHWKGRQAVIEEMTRFGESFIREFERPLIQPRAPAPAVRSRLRFKPHRGRLEVLLAPGVGRSYPNLLDHRKNVEYDMERVLHELRHQPFVSASLQQRGHWVVVPFEVKANQKQEGTT